MYELIENLDGISIPVLRWEKEDSYLNLAPTLLSSSSLSL